MNLSTSECSSGCESGWTTYLDQFSDSTNPNTNNYVQNYEEKRGNLNEDEDEDLSMVSDASSGPPNLRVGPHYYGYASSVHQDIKKGKNNHKKNKSKSKEMKMNMQQSFCLDDTASSPNFHKDNAVPPDQNHYSGEQSQDESTLKKRFGFLKSSGKGKSGSFLGRKRQ